MSSRELLASPRVAPSILSADFARLGEQVETVMEAGARVIHVDVMDGHFVPPITIGDLIARSIEEQVHAAGGIVDVHLMIERPERQIAAFAEAGADVITVHQEATPHVHYALKAVRDAGLPGRARHLPGHVGRARARGRARHRRAALHDREPRLGRPAVHRALDRRSSSGSSGCCRRRS